MMIRRLLIICLFVSVGAVGCTDDDQLGDNNPQGGADAVDQNPDASDDDGATDPSDADRPDADDAADAPGDGDRVDTPDDGGDAPDPQPDGGDDAGDVPPGACDEDGPDCDYDGLLDCEEERVGTDPCDHHTDDDGVSDLDEFLNATDPFEPDTDGDGVDDGKEVDLGLDPTKESTYDDGILDADRWIVSACDDPQTEDINFRTHNDANWLVALPPSFNTNYTELIFDNATVGNRLAAAMYDDPTNEVAGFLLSSKPSSWNTLLEDYFNASASIGERDQETFGSEFPTHDYRSAKILRFVLRTQNKRTVKSVREDLFKAMVDDPSQVSGFPSTSGGPYNDFRVFISVIRRQYQSGEEQVITSLAIAPDEKWKVRDRVKMRMDDLSNTTNIASAEDDHRVRCDLEKAKESPGADFYWVLDHSGSMSTVNSQMAALANDFYNELNNTNLDWRLGVTHMDGTQGRLRPQAGWHTDHHTFTNEVNHVISESGADEWGLKLAQEGIEYMKGLTGNPPSNMQIRPYAQLVTIWVTDEEAESIQNNPLGGAPGQQMLNDYISFFTQHTIGFAIVGDGNGCGLSHGQAYQLVASDTGGSYASICSTDLSETIDDIIHATSGSTGYELPETPISSSLRVHLNGEWVPRSRENGFDYFAEYNAITFFGDFRPEVPENEGEPHDHISVSYETFVDLTKDE